MSGLVVVPGSGTEGFVELTRTSPKFRRFRKQILHWGDFVHPASPGKKVHIDRQFAERLQANFRSGMCDIVQVPIVNDKNQHVEDPTRNIGQVVDLSFDDQGVFAVIEARKHAEDLGSTLLGASALMHLDYKDTRTGHNVGPTLLHVAVTNRPYLTNLGGFEEFIAASADTDSEPAVLLLEASGSTLEAPVLMDQAIAVLKENGIDVPALQAQAELQDGELLTALSNVLAPESESVISLTDVAQAVVEMAEEKIELSAQVADLSSSLLDLQIKDATNEVDKLVREGRVLPKQRDAMVALSITDPETFKQLVPDDSIVAFSEQGLSTFEEATSDKLTGNIERLTALANSMNK